MTRETKIGLLVGLGFIILFGIILSEAGSRRRAIVAPQYGPLADAQRDYVQPGPSVMLGPLEPDGDFAEPEPVLAAAESVAAEKPARQEPVVTDGSDRTSPSAEPTADNTPSPEFVAYVVRKNDNLTKIAKRVMQTDSRKAVEAIFAANRDRLVSKDRLRVGQKLRIPMSPKRAELSPAPDFAGALVHAEQPVALTARAEPKYRWYQVRRKDTWSSIARRELGEEGRWPELYELNRKAFPNPHHLRPGVRVKLPTKGGANRVAAAVDALRGRAVMQ